MNRDRQLKLSQLRILVTVAECGNFSEAALHLNLSQSAVSHAIATLETQLGVILLSRGRYGARLTPVGDRIIAHAYKIVQHVEAIRHEADLAKGLQGGQVRVATFRSIAARLMPQVISEFHQRFPAIAVSLNEREDYPHVEQALREGQADIGFTYLPTSQEFTAWEVLRDEFVALLPPSFHSAKLELSWPELAAHSFILPPDDVMMMRVRQHCLAHGYPLKVAYEMDTDSAIVTLVAQGLGATILPRLAAQPIPPGVQAYSLPVPLFRRIGVAVLAEALHVPAVFAFLDVLKEQARSLQQTLYVTEPTDSIAPRSS